MQQVNEIEVPFNLNDFAFCRFGIFEMNKIVHQNVVVERVKFRSMAIIEA